MAMLRLRVTGAAGGRHVAPRLYITKRFKFRICTAASLSTRRQEREEGNAAHLSLARRVAQLLARVGDLLEGTREAQLVAVEEGADVVVLALVEVDLLGVGAQVLHLAADEDVPAGHVLSDLLAGPAAAPWCSELALGRGG